MVPPTQIEVSKLARIVLDEAENGDPRARALVVQLGTRLAEYVLVAARKVGIADQTFTLVLNGGLFRHRGRLLVDTVTAVIQQQTPHITPVRGRYEPAVGAVLLALETAGVEVSAERLTALETSLPPSKLFLT
ncbi:MAG: hypothetical protein IPK17_11225 [Chloroflexi bacterium]|uniref:BadF/BadG/BcrA/BcrD ATPase family protein n=1 Tax=Candidatus Flexifilum breve TaxID=3140694 RepID=UPI0031355748|nr:hypothetical protein [Chloroflexota bacterium]